MKAASQMRLWIPRRVGAGFSTSALPTGHAAGDAGNFALSLLSGNFRHRYATPPITEQLNISGIRHEEAMGREKSKQSSLKWTVRPSNRWDRKLIRANPSSFTGSLISDCTCYLNSIFFFTKNYHRNRDSIPHTMLRNIGRKDMGTSFCF